MANPVPPSFSKKVAAYLTAAGHPVDPAATDRLLNMWEPWEGASASYNPLATIQQMPGDSFYNDLNNRENGYKVRSGITTSGVRNYATEDQGAEATAKTLLGDPRFQPIIDAMSTGKIDASIAPALRIWGTSGFADQLEGGGPVPSAAGAKPQAGPGTQAGSGAPGPGSAQAKLKALRQYMLDNGLEMLPGAADSVGGQALGLKIGKPGGTSVVPGTGTPITAGSPLIGETNPATGKPYQVGDEVGGKTAKTAAQIDKKATQMLYDYEDAVQREQMAAKLNPSRPALTSAEAYYGTDAAHATGEATREFDDFAKRADELYKLQDADRRYSIEGEAANIAHGTAANKGEIYPDEGRYYLPTRPGYGPGQGVPLSQIIQRSMPGSVLADIPLVPSSGGGGGSGPFPYSSLPSDDTSGFVDTPPPADEYGLPFSQDDLPRYAGGTASAIAARAVPPQGGGVPKYPSGRPIPADVLAMVGQPVFPRGAMPPGTRGIPNVAALRGGAR